jgi:hypothetical protein
MVSPGLIRECWWMVDGGGEVGHVGDRFMGRRTRMPASEPWCRLQGSVSWGCLATSRCPVSVWGPVSMKQVPTGTQEGVVGGSTGGASLMLEERAATHSRSTADAVRDQVQQGRGVEADGLESAGVVRLDEAALWLAVSATRRQVSTERSCVATPIHGWPCSLEKNAATA